MTGAIFYAPNGVFKKQKLKKGHYLLMAMHLLERNREIYKEHGPILYNEDKLLDRTLEYKQALFECFGDKKKADYRFCELYYKNVKKDLFTYTDFLEKNVEDLSDHVKGDFGLHSDTCDLYFPPWFRLNTNFKAGKYTLLEELREKSKDKLTWHSDYFQNRLIEEYEDDSSLQKEGILWDDVENLVYINNLEIGKKELYTGWYAYHEKKELQLLCFVRYGVILLITDRRYPSMYSELDSNYIDFNESSSEQFKPFKNEEDKFEEDKFDETILNIFIIRTKNSHFLELKFWPKNKSEDNILKSITYSKDKFDENIHKEKVINEFQFYLDGNIRNFNDFNDKREIFKVTFFHPNDFEKSDVVDFSIRRIKGLIPSYRKSLYVFNVEDNEKLFYEFQSNEKKDKSIVYHTKHYKDDRIISNKYIDYDGNIDERAKRDTFFGKIINFFK